MKKIALEIISGIVLSFAGIYLGYLFLISLDNGGNFLFLGLTVLLLGAGGYLLYRATNTDVNVENKDATVIPTNQEPIASMGVESMLKRNNDIAEQWKKTNDQRDKLKLLEIANNAEKAG